MVTPLLQVHWYNGPRTAMTDQRAHSSYLCLTFWHSHTSSCQRASRVAHLHQVSHRHSPAHDGVKNRTFKSFWAGTVSNICDFRVVYFNSEIFGNYLDIGRCFFIFLVFWRNLTYSFSKILRNFGKSIMETLLSRQQSKILKHELVHRQRLKWFSIVVANRKC